MTWGCTDIFVCDINEKLADNYYKIDELLRENCQADHPYTMIGGRNNNRKRKISSIQVAEYTRVVYDSSSNPVVEYSRQP